MFTIRLQGPGLSVMAKKDSVKTFDLHEREFIGLKTVKLVSRHFGVFFSHSFFLSFLFFERSWRFTL